MTDETIKGEVRNGARVAVVFPWYSGPAGVQHTDRGMQVAYFSRSTAKAPATGTVDGQAVEVIAAERSRTVEGVAVLTVKIVADPA